MNSKVCTISLLLAWLVSFTGRPVEAQDFRLDRYRAAEHPADGFAVRGVRELDSLALFGVVSADYAHDPLALEVTRGAETREQVLVRHQLTLRLDLSLALFGRVLVFAGLEGVPVLRAPAESTLAQAAEGGGFGDLSLGLRVRLLGRDDDLFALGVQAALIAPTASGSRYLGEAGVAVRPELIAELRPAHLRLRLNLGGLVRAGERLLDARIGSELLYGFGAYVPIVRALELTGELFGSFGVHDFGSRSSSSLEWLLGGRAELGRGLTLGLAAGRGVTSGVGTPDARIVARLGYGLNLRRTHAAGEQESSDRDGDTVPDRSDGCVAEPEDRDGFDDDDGCPELDNDNDGISAALDACPSVPGRVESQGCPSEPAPAEPPAPAATVQEESSLGLLANILFENNSDVISAESVPHLETVLGTLERHPELTRLRIEGHTDSVGQDARNLRLSQQRAGAVRRWLLEHGVEARRIEAFGCGEKHPVAGDESPEGRAQNRRVVFLSSPEGAASDCAAVTTP